MNTSTVRKFSKRKFQSKSGKSQHAHMKQIILQSTVLEFIYFIFDRFMEENDLASLSLNKNQDHKQRRSPKKLKYSQPIAPRHIQNQPPTKKIVSRGEYTPWKKIIQIYTTTNILVQSTKSEILQKLLTESFLLLEICIHYFLYREF